eukprot:scaffold6708_cov134-Cylindrotheca_fusiformis.AAC.19
MASYSFLEPFMEFFQCGGGQDLNHQIFMDEEPSSAGKKDPVPSTTSIYSLPSRESMNEVRRDSMNRFAASPLFSFTSSPPMEFTFDDGDENGLTEKRDDSLRLARPRSDEDNPLVSGKRVHSMTTVSTADNSSIVDIRRTESEELPDYQFQFVAERE